MRVVGPIHRANRQTALFLEGAFDDLGTSSPEAHLLAYIHFHGPCSVGLLVRVFGYKKPTMTGMLDRLEERKLIRREVNPEDRRSFLVTTTARGKRSAEEARVRVRKLDARIQARVSDRDLEGFERVLRGWPRSMS